MKDLSPRSFVLGFFVGLVTALLLAYCFNNYYSRSYAREAQMERARADVFKRELDGLGVTSGKLQALKEELETLRREEKLLRLRAELHEAVLEDNQLSRPAGRRDDKAAQGESDLRRIIEEIRRNAPPDSRPRTEIINLLRDSEQAELQLRDAEELLQKMRRELHGPLQPAPAGER